MEEGSKDLSDKAGSTVAFLHLEMDLVFWAGFHGEVCKVWSMISGTEGAQSL